MCKSTTLATAQPSYLIATTTTILLQAPPAQLLLLLLLSLVTRLQMSFNQAADAAVNIQMQATIIRKVFNGIEVIQQATAGGSGALICQPEPWPWHPSEL